MRLAAAIALACLAGCATTAADLVKDGYRFDFMSKSPPRAVAACIAKNMEDHWSGGGSPTVRDREITGALQVYLTAPGYGIPLFLVHVDPATDGSRVTMHTYPGVRSIYTDRAADYMKGC